jgi:hypothetical protein
VCRSEQNNDNDQRSKAKDAALPLTRLDWEYKHKRDTESDGQPNGHRNQLQSDLEASQVRRRAAGGLLGCKMQQAAITQARRQLKQYTGDLVRRSCSVCLQA